LPKCELTTTKYLFLHFVYRFSAMTYSRRIIYTRASSSLTSTLLLLLVVSSSYSCHASTVAVPGSVAVVHKMPPTYSNSRRRVPFTKFHDWGQTSTELRKQQDSIDCNKVVDCSVRGYLRRRFWSITATGYILIPSFTDFASFFARSPTILCGDPFCVLRRICPVGHHWKLSSVKQP
jgi:hypothetical protein